MEIPLLKNIIVIFGVSIVVIFICHRIRLPVIVGFLLTGILVGPHGLGLVKAVHGVEILAQIELRKRYGVTVLAIRRGSKILPNPHGEMHLCANDVLFVLGPPEKIAGAMSLFHNSEEREAS